MLMKPVKDTIHICYAFSHIDIVDPCECVVAEVPTTSTKEDRSSLQVTLSTATQRWLDVKRAVGLSVHEIPLPEGGIKRKSDAVETRPQNKTRLAA